MSKKKLKNSTDKNSEYAFVRGWLQVKNGDLNACREKLMNGLCILTRAAFLNRLNGKVEPKISEKKIIESIFAEFGITEVWGNA